MQATRVRLLAHGLALFTIAFASCSDHDEAVGDPSSGAGNSSCTACAGEAAGGSGDGGHGPASGGAQTLQPIAGTTTAGSSGAPSGGGGNTLGGEGGGPPDGPLLEELTLCDRLTQVPDKNLKTTKQFELSVYTDCRVNWLARLYVDAKKRDDYLNDLLIWNEKFWGCQALPVPDFLLVWGTPPMSQGDADIVIEHYVAAAIEQLKLTQKEEKEMRDALGRLSTPLVTSPSLEPSKASCTDPNGGAGGQSGAAGAPSESGAGGAAGGGGEGGHAGGAVSAGGAP